MKTDSPLERTARRLKVGVKNGLGLRGLRQVTIVAGPAKGLTMTLDFAGQTPMYLGMFEWELHRFFRYALAEAQLVFDVGGYNGYDALLFAANSRARVMTFEPDEEHSRLIQQNVACNPEIQSRILVTPVAIGNRNTGALTTLDSFSESVGVPDFIKVDIDGGELDALEGARSTLRDRRPHLVVETHSFELEQACGRLLVDCGYRPAIKHNRRVWREHRGGVPHNRWLLARGLPRVGS